MSGVQEHRKENHIWLRQHFSSTPRMCRSIQVDFGSYVWRSVSCVQLWLKGRTHGKEAIFERSTGGRLECQSGLSIWQERDLTI
jgi:hypothetical protein